MHGAAHHVLRLEPQPLVVHVFLAEPLLAVQAQAHHVFLDAKQGEVLEIQVDHAQEFLLELVLRDVDVRIVHLQRADAHQAEQLAGFLVAVARAIFRQADRQVAIRARLGTEDLVVHRAVHRLDVVLHALELHRRVHALGVVRQVPGVDEEVFLGKVRRAHPQVARLLFHFLGQLFDLLDHHAAVGREQRQPRARPHRRRRRFPAPCPACGGRASWLLRAATDSPSAAAAFSQTVP